MQCEMYSVQIKAKIKIFLHATQTFQISCTYRDHIHIEYYVIQEILLDKSNILEVCVENCLEM